MKKTSLAILALILPLCALPFSVSAAEKEMPEATIEERLAQIDLSVTLKMYEKVRLAVAEAEFPDRLSHSAPRSAEQQKAHEIWGISMRQMIENLRAKAIELDAQIKDICRKSALKKTQEVDAAPSPLAR